MKNAFDVLTASARRRSTQSQRVADSTRTPAASKGTYATCPLCQRTIPLAFAEAHVSVCLATPAHPPLTQLPSSQPTPANGRARSPPIGSTPGAQPSPAALQNQQSFPVESHPTQQEPPVDLTAVEVACENAISCSHDKGADALAESIDCSEDEHPKQDQALPPPPEQQQLKQQAEPRPRQSTLPAPSGQPQATQGLSDLPGPSQAVATVPSAFDIMRQSQLRAASRCHNFFLERTVDGAWLGHCWAKGSSTQAQQRLAASSCWSVTLSVATGGKGGPADGSAGKETVCLMTNVPPGHGGVVSWSTEGLISNALPPEGRWRGGPSVLKSALQKAVRLGRGACAVRCALHLVKEDGGMAQLLRRLSIVCVEDAILHPGLPLVVWLMAAQAKGFSPGATHLDALLRLVYQLATVQVRDGLPDAWDAEPAANAFASISATTQEGPATLRQVDDLQLLPAEACLVKCLLIRGSYGGMGGDVRMMRGFAAYWAARFRGAAAAPPTTFTQADPRSKDAPCATTPLHLHGPTGRADPPAGIHRPEPSTAIRGHSAAASSPSEPPLGTNADVPERAGGDAEGSEQRRTGPGGCEGGTRDLLTGSELHRGQATPCPEARPGSLPAAAPGTSSGACRTAPQLEGMGVGGGGCDGPQGPSWPGPSQGPPRARISDAYFAVRLQAEDAPPSCGAFIPASQLLAEALQEQQSLHRVAASAAATSSQAQWAGSTLPAWTQPAGLSLEGATAGWLGGTQAPWGTATQCAASGQQPSQQQPQHSRRDGAGVVRPLWCAPVASPSTGAHPGEESGGGGGGDDCRRRSLWLAYLCDLYDQVPVPTPLSETISVGPLRRSDVPLSAVDFHVSDVVTRLLERPDVMAAASARPGTTPEDAEDSLKSAMWLFRSCKNPKAWVHTLSPCCRGAVDAERACEEHRSLATQLAEEERGRDALAPLWNAAASWADRFSASYIGRRFGPP